MKTLQEDHYRVAFVQGYEGKMANPYFTTSNNSDAFELGAYVARMSLDIDTALHKSSGYCWILGGVKFLVNGRKITAKINPPT